MILQYESKNYNALVFLGLCEAELGELKSAAEVYNSAIESSPNEPLAYQGLASFYEKHKDVEDKKQLVNIYNKLTEFYKR